MSLTYPIEYDTPYKLFLAAMIVATKYIEDYASHAVSIYRIVAPLYTSRELNEMERSFLGVLKVTTYIPPPTHTQSTHGLMSS